ncbi:hypothetical protein H6P81_005891 [Aristolochia fimbriata]|uniref:Uncharacterized protein n=1 Tax=Aristolochia fimbriata TaxID=158543 RepID=A0AAV7EZM0_ARIFI|nr:hypothetical protein H6P81_005891 [Aristolochia fimbriata]
MEEIQHQIGTIEDLNSLMEELHQKQQVTTFERGLTPGPSSSKTMTDNSPKFQQRDHRSMTIEEFQMAIKRVELLSFNSVDPEDWVSKAEQYFEVQAIQLEVKVQLAYVSMEGGVIYWFSGPVGFGWLSGRGSRPRHSATLPATSDSLPPASSSSSAATGTPTTTTKGRGMPKRGSRGSPHISYPEFLEKKVKGLCVCCDEPFHPLHQCSNKSL